MNRRFKVAFIGTGGRSVVYGRTYSDCPDIEVVALADPSTRNRKTMIAKSRITSHPADFLMNFNCMGPRADRNFHAVGTKGRVWASVYDRKVWLYENGSGRTTEFDASGDGSGHGGGDRLHALLLREMMLDPSFRPACDASAGYLSAVTCFAADVSRLERRRVALRYDAEGRVSVL